jgi:hypothetical protein
MNQSTDVSPTLSLLVAAVSFQCQSIINSAIRNYGGMSAEESLASGAVKTAIDI